MNLGIFLTGRKHHVVAYTRSRADDLWSNCSAWGPWRGTAQLHHGAEYAARGIVQTGILIFERGKTNSDAQIAVETIRSPIAAAWHEL
jgi:hypothetical protein